MFYGCTSLKVSSTQTGSYQYSWRIPTSGQGTTASYWSLNMLSGTGGTFKDDPSINTTYYVENPPVVETPPVPAPSTTAFNGAHWDILVDVAQDFVGATTSNDGAHGLVPAPSSDDRNSFLKGDGT
jgi:hypothetical protein